MTYKITIGSFDILKNFNSEEALISWANTELGEGYTFEVAATQIPEKTELEKLIERRKIGEDFVTRHHLDNHLFSLNRGYELTEEEYTTQLVKLQLIEALLKAGSLKQALDKLIVLTPDSILTQERLNSYIQELQNYVNNYNNMQILRRANEIPLESAAIDFGITES